MLYLFRWQYTVKIIICVIYIPRHNLESVIVKYSKYPHRCGDWQKHIYLKTSDSSAPEPCRSTTHTIKIILQAAAIPGFQTEMATERQNLRTAALNEQQINKAVFVFFLKETGLMKIIYIYKPLVHTPVKQVHLNRRRRRGIKGRRRTKTTTLTVTKLNVPGSWSYLLVDLSRHNLKRMDYTSLGL